MSIPGGQNLPYRPPCDSTVLCGNGPRYQHGKTSEMNIGVFIYDAQVPNWDVDVGGDIAPYERYLDNEGGPNCVPNGCIGTDTCDPGGAPPCVSWIGTSSCQYNTSNTVPTPTYYQPQIATEAVIANAGSGYQVGDVLRANGGNVSGYIPANGIEWPTSTAQLTVANVSNTGAILNATISSTGSYRTLPSSPNSVIGGHGTGASFDFTWANQTENISPCFKYGFKNVQAARQWHGAPGFFFLGNYDVYTCPLDTFNDETLETPVASCVPQVYSEYSPNAVQTKYLDISCEISGSFYQFNGTCYGGPGGEQIDPLLTDTYEYTASVGADTGVVTINSGSSGCGAAGAFADLISGDMSFWLDRFVTGVLGSSYAPPDTTGLSCSDSGYSFTNTEGDTITGEASWSFGDGTFSGSHWYQDLSEGDDGEGGNYQIESVSITDDSLSYSYELQQMTEGSGVWTTLVTFTMSITLSTTNTAADVLSDVYTLLDEWDLTDDAVYPWRNDSNTSIAPLVVRNEAQSNISPFNLAPFVCTATEINDCFGDTPADPLYVNTYATDLNVDPNAPLYDGSIIGAPLAAGYQGWFDFYANDWEDCFDSDTETFYGYQLGWGLQNIAQNGIPRTATHWTSNNIGWQLPGGAWVFYNHNSSWERCDYSDLSNTYTFQPINLGGGPGPMCIAQKWAETKMPFPSQNFARPGGDDKFVFDENNVFTINSSNSTNGVITKVNLVTTAGCVNANVSNAGIWGGASVNGFFEVSGNGSPFTLGTKIFDLPSDWSSRGSLYNANSMSTTSDSNAAFGLLRFPNAPAFLGLASVANVANSNANANTVQLTTDSLPDMGMGINANANADYIDILDFNSSVLASNQAVTRIDDTHFTINANFSTLQNAHHIQINGAPAYYWDDQYPKGDYVYSEWYWWPRLLCEADRWNTLVNGCNANCDCPNGTQTLYCYPFFNPMQDNAGNFGNAFTLTADCLGFTPCNPSVICISPNEETFTLGTTYDFPESVYFDEQYGSGWQAEIQQIMEDLLYQSPHFPAGAPCTLANYAWLEDSGSCQSDSNSAVYYPIRPYVECRITLPDNGGPNSTASAPSLPNGINIGWDSPAGILSNSANCGGTLIDPSFPSEVNGPGGILFPPNVNGYGLSAGTVWNLWSNLCGCIDQNGQFATTYQNQVIGCQ